MHLRSRGVVASLIAGVVACATAAPAAADEFEPLNQYRVSGAKAGGDVLARAGFDLIEGRGADGKLGIVATERQARALRGQGLQVARVGGRAAHPPDPPGVIADPTYGWDVFRPWATQPAPCPTTCTTPRVNLKTFYQELADQHPETVRRVVIGHTQNTGQEIVAYRVTAGARRSRDGSKPVVLYNAVQHAREWIAAEVERRLFQYVLAHEDDDATRVPRILRDTELWFVPIVNPDGYDWTFVSKATRLWRKNLRDVDGDGQITNGDGVDPNRNWPVKWNWDLEGSSDDPASETYHGTGPASESEVSSLERLEARLRPRFQIDYHSYGQLILYPEGWQVETPATDAPLLEALAGTDDAPAIEGYDPDVSAELYTTNGDITDNSLTKFGTQAYTVELSGGAGDPVGGTVEGPNSFAPNGFVFQDSEAAVQAEFARNLDFALDLAESAPTPDEPRSHLGNTAPDFVPTTFPISYGDPQTVEVNAKRRLGKVRVHWRVDGGPTRSGDTRVYEGGERYGEPGAYYHRLRGKVRGTRPGDRVEVWFSAGGRRSEPFTYTARSESDDKVLILAAEDYTGTSPPPVAGPQYEAYFRQALDDAGVGSDTYDVDANGRIAPTSLGVLSHYRAVVWYTGDDLYTREPDQPGGTGVSRLLDQEILAVRDYLNDGGKALVNGKTALQGAWDQFLFNPLGRPPDCRSNLSAGGGDADDPPGQEENCIATSNDFQQYWLGAYSNITAASDEDAAALLPFVGAGEPFGTTEFTLNGPDSAQNQDNVYSFLTTSSILPPDEYPQFTSRQAIRFDRPPSFDPPTGSQYVFSGASNGAYKRLSRTVDLTGRSTGSLEFKISYDTEPGWDYVFVEAHTVGADDWTTLPDENGHTSQDLGESCTEIPMVELHPFLAHYETYTAPPGGSATCAPTGTTGVWNAATGNSAGFQDWRVDLSAFAGRQVEVSITYVSDPAVQGLGVLVDDARVTADGATLAETSFEDDLGGWVVSGAPAGSPGNSNDWARSGSLGYVDGPGVATDDTLYWGFGLEGVTGRQTRTALMRDALRHLLRSGNGGGHGRADGKVGSTAARSGGALVARRAVTPAR